KVYTNNKKLKKVQKFSGRVGTVVGILLLLFVIGMIAFQWAIEYIWMDSLEFGSVFTTILNSKIMLGGAGFVIYSFVTWLTLSWIKRSYFSHFDSEQLPPF